MFRGGRLLRKLFFFTHEILDCCSNAIMVIIGGNIFTNCFDLIVCISHRNWKTYTAKHSAVIVCITDTNSLAEGYAQTLCKLRKAGFFCHMFRGHFQ